MSDQKYDIRVIAQATFIPEQSNESRYVFAYRVRIRNEGSLSAQLISRHWIITNADNEVQEVRGLGVIGEQPTLAPGEEYEYSSGSALTTSMGTMKGTYQMVAEDGMKFDAPIPEFVLSVPRVLH